MLRKRSRPVQNDMSKGHLILDSSADSCLPSHGLVQKVRNSSLFTVPGLFVGFSNKGLLDSEAARSPRSPLDFKCLSNLGSSLLGSPRSPRSPGGGVKPRFWDSSRVGLSLVDTLNDEVKPSEKVMVMNIPSPISHLTCLRDDSLGAAAPKSLPKDYGITSFPFVGSPKLGVGSSKLASRSKGVEFELGEIGIARSSSEEIRRSASPLLTRFSYHDSKPNSEVLQSEVKKSVLDFPQPLKGFANCTNSYGPIPAVNNGSSHELIGLLSPSEIEQSEDYTCIISHGPNPKTTHFFGDCLIDSHIIQSPDLNNKLRKEGERSAWLLKKPSTDLPPCSADDFLSFCFSCKKKLEEGHDIYIYRGEKAFCSSDCRDQEILIEEEMEKASSSSISLGSSFYEEIFLEG